jgi:arylsulfatase A-like enzyme
LDRFAAEGVEFENFYVSPVCAPTRAALLTGRHHYRTGVIHTSRGGAKMHADEVTIAERLQKAGYRTGIFGKWHLGDNYPMRPMDQGFAETLVHKSGGIGQAPDRPSDYFDPVLWRNGERIEGEGYCTDIFFEAAMDFMERNREAPFFAYIPTNTPHTPLVVDDKYARPYLDAGLDETTAKVYGMVENIDENFAGLIAKIDELGLRENTIVVFITDNGPQQRRYNAGLRGRKSSIYEGGIRAISIWQWPGQLKAPARIESIAAHIDVAPTLLEAAGVEMTERPRFDGRSLLAALRAGVDDPNERALFFQCHRGLRPRLYQNAAVRTKRFKLVLGPGTFADEGWTYDGTLPPIELYDLNVDPGELNDLAAERPEVVGNLRQQYEEWFEGVREEREFEPGVIHLGSEREPVSILCRYQDSTYVDGHPTTWKVRVERAGNYEVRVKRTEESWWRGPATVFASVNGELGEQHLEAGANTVVLGLPQGDAELDVWVQAPGKTRELVTDNSAVGDVEIRWTE